MLVLVFRQAEDAPHYNREKDQVIGWQHRGEFFPLRDYTEPFPLIAQRGEMEYGRWVTYRFENTVYVAHISAARASVSPVCDALISFFRAETHEQLDSLKNALEKRYGVDRDAFEAAKIMQTVLSQQEYYSGRIDGMFGEESRKALQRLLKDSGYYDGTVDGLLGKRSIAALYACQTDLKVEPSGSIDKQTAEAMADEDRR